MSTSEGKTQGHIHGSGYSAFRSDEEEVRYLGIKSI
jgi:hypothetical protein